MTLRSPGGLGCTNFNPFSGFACLALIVRRFASSVWLWNKSGLWRLTTCPERLSDIDFQSSVVQQRNFPQQLSKLAHRSRSHPPQSQLLDHGCLQRFKAGNRADCVRQKGDFCDLRRREFFG